MEYNPPKMKYTSNIILSILILIVPACLHTYLHSSNSDIQSFVTFSILIVLNIILGLIWYVKLYIYRKNFIKEAQELITTQNRNILNLTNKVTKIELINTDLTATNKQLEANRDGLIALNKELTQDYDDLDVSYKNLIQAIYFLALTHPEIKEAFKAYNESKEIIDGTKEISHS